MNKDHKINLQPQNIRTDAQAADMSQQGYENVKSMMEEMEQKILEYNLLLDEVKALKDAYTGQVARMRHLIRDYHAQIGGIL